MDCRDAQERIGAHLDGELPPGETSAFEEHLSLCDACTAELARQRTLISSLIASDPAERVPGAADVWERIESRLESDRPQPRLIRLFHRPLALAASLGLLIGAAAFVAVWLNPSAPVVQADAIDYRFLLDDLGKDAEASVNRFLDHYHGVRMNPAVIAAQASPMRFEIPDTLPGGFALQESYRLQFGANVGYAARYRNESGEPVFVFFHPPVEQTVLGVHRDSHCSLAQFQYSGRGRNSA